MAVVEAKFDWQDATAFSFSVFLLQTCQSDGTWTKHIACQYLITLGSMDIWFGLHREKVLCMHLRLKQNPYLSLSISYRGKSNRVFLEVLYQKLPIPLLRASLKLARNDNILLLLESVSCCANTLLSSNPFPQTLAILHAYRTTPSLDIFRSSEADFCLSRKSEFL